ncbi:unnamed protein product [Parnassius mnemosyne]|uniref:Mitochondrial transcription termination factor n=1 Tax=Parnassius mnemosyne TaxID=213953 RepID=A0AAV1M0I4_9NEOP
MFVRQIYLYSRFSCSFRYLGLNVSDYSVCRLCKYLNIDEIKAKHLLVKQPVLKKLNEENIKGLLETFDELGFSKDVMISYPALCSLLPVTLKFRYKVLQECGIENVTPAHLLSYLNLVKQNTIGQLKSDGLILNCVNVENRLASYMTQWPTSLTTLVYGDVNTISLYSLRLKIIQRYLELMLDLSCDEFYRGLKTYPTIKHRPLKVINETLNILQTELMIPHYKIKSNLYLIHADPDNLKNILYKFRSIGGIDIKEIVRLHPKIAMKSYYSMLEIRKVLQEFNVSNEAQMRCFEIYTLSPKTVRERLQKAQSIPEFCTYSNHPRFLKMIYYNKTAMKRLLKLYSFNKKCLSLNILSGSAAHYETYEKSPGDRLGKGKDLVFCISQALGCTFKSSDIRQAIKRHPFWINIPLVQIKFVFDKLINKFSPQDIYDNCPILLYPWNKIKDVINILEKNQAHIQLYHESLDLSQLSSSQKLSLVLYLLEKNHYFTGNGVWNEDKNKSNADFVSEHKNERAFKLVNNN